MNRQSLEHEVISYLRATALAGSDRPIELDKPLGEMGLNLDSLTLLTFFSGLEKSFGIEFLEAHWMGRADLTLRELLDVIERSARKECRLEVVSLPSRPRSIGEAWRTMGFVRGSFWLAGWALGQAARRVYHRDTYAILEHPLGKKALTPHHAAEDVQVSQGTLADVGALAALYPRSKLKSALREFHDRLGSGYICLMAWYGAHPVGIDWIAPTHHEDSITGLTYRMSEGTCCGVDLYEHPRWRGRGVGLTLLLASLREAEARGYRRQVTVVSKANLPMLAAGVQLVGFKQVGSIETTRFLLRPYSRWRMGQERGKGRTLLL